uniref:Translocase of outer mitochondrial membrane 20b n=1 Tax=Cyprinus carpio TaxID=7962 RepID=A0A8C1QU01_CYPCA
MMGGSSSSRIAAGLGAALFVGYCIYSDRKRGRDPNYKNKLRERRKKQKAVQEKAGLSKLPDLKDAEAVQNCKNISTSIKSEHLFFCSVGSAVSPLNNEACVCFLPGFIIKFCPLVLFLNPPE